VRNTVRVCKFNFQPLEFERAISSAQALTAALVSLLDHRPVPRASLALKDLFHATVTCHPESHGSVQPFDVGHPILRGLKINLKSRK
jgi:hypothetical protein